MRWVEESAESQQRHMHLDSTAVFRNYLSGSRVLDIGYRGGFGETEPIAPQAIGVDFGYLGYDGVNLPFELNSQDAIYSSHCLEHIENAHDVISCLLYTSDAADE